MTWLVLVLLLAALLGLIAWKRHDPPMEPVDPEAEAEAAIELHRIGRRLDVAFTKTEQKRDMARLWREMGEALDDEANG
jgi:hypothetical protein